MIQRERVKPYTKRTSFRGTLPSEDEEIGVEKEERKRKWPAEHEEGEENRKRLADKGNYCGTPSANGCVWGGKDGGSSWERVRGFGWFVRVFLVLAASHVCFAAGSSDGDFGGVAS